MTLRMVAGLNPSRLPRAKVRDPTGSPVVMKVSTIAVRISRSRSPIGCPDCIEFLPRGSHSAKTLKNNSLGRQQPKLPLLILGRGVGHVTHYHSQYQNANR